MRLSRGLAMPLWEPFLSNPDASGLAKETQDYIRNLAQQIEYAVFNLPPNCNGERAWQELRTALRRAHEISVQKANPDEQYRAQRNEIWRRIYRAVCEFYRTAETERADRRSWFCARTPERPAPGPVVLSFFKDVADVIDLIEWAYRDAIGDQGRIHANIQFRMEMIPPPSIQQNRGPSDIKLIEGQVTGEFGESDHNPHPPRAKRARRVNINIPFPCDLYTAFGLEGVLAHELGVHLYEQLANPEGPLARGARMGFAEGFVDTAITTLLRDAANGSGATGAIVSEHVARGAMKRYNDRPFMDVPTTVNGREAVDWYNEIKHGREFWNNTVKLGTALSEEVRNGVSPEIWARKTALKLNVLDLGVEYRHALMTGANYSLGMQALALNLGTAAASIKLLADALCRLHTITDLAEASSFIKAFVEDTDGYAALLG